MKPFDRATEARVRNFMSRMSSEPSRFDEGFPEGFEEYLFLYSNYMRRGHLAAAFDAARSIGNTELLFIAKEVPVGEESWDRVVGVDELEVLAEHMDWALEYYLAGPELEWLIWAYHEPCLHIGGSRRFIAAFKLAYPPWEAEYSPWYEPGGIPVCGRCGVWWHPGLGDWRARNWECPDHSGDRTSVKPVNRTGFPWLEK